MKKTTQAMQVIEAMRKEGGYATLRRLNEVVDFSTWATKTPEATVRRIVQDSKEIFRIQPGLWALEEMRDEVLNMFELKVGDKHSEELFTHGYYQGLLIEIGKFNQQLTYVPAQDKSRKFMGRQLLAELSDTTTLPDFTYSNVLIGGRNTSFYADKLCVTERYLYKICKKETGQSPKEIIDNFLVSAIKNSLLTTEMSLQQIADQYRFPDQSAFSQYFKRHEGISPSEFRRRYR